MSDQKAPSGLKASGRRLWAAIAEPYVLTPAELANLAEACRTADELDRLEKAVRALPDLVVPGSTGQPKVHPLLEEVRRHRLLLERLTTALNLPDDDQLIGDRGPTRHARKAARSRWQAWKEYQNGDAPHTAAAWRAKLPIKSVPTPRPQEERDLGDDASRLVTDKAGNFAPSGYDPPAAPSASQESATSATSATGPPYYTCLTEGCTTGLYADDS